MQQCRLFAVKRTLISDSRRFKSFAHHKVLKPTLNFHFVLEMYDMVFVIGFSGAQSFGKCLAVRTKFA
jgi:hypothetical protein